jgi:hypothetical protein
MQFHKETPAKQNSRLLNGPGVPYSYDQATLYQDFQRRRQFTRLSLIAHSHHSMLNE